MDSLTQFALGAAVSTAFLGKTLGPRKAALIGGLLGTLPDLDVFLPFDDPVDSFVLHRGWTHSFFVHALAAPLLGEGLVRVFKGLREKRWLTYAAVYLCFVTHALIDAITIYGTRVFWPLDPDPVGVGSVFIIDPLYSLPLLGVVIWAFFKGAWSRRFSRALSAILLITTGYLGLSLVLQSHVEARAQRIFAEQGIKPDALLALAAPFNTVVWKVIAVDQDKYHNLYVSLLDGSAPPPVYSHPRRLDLTACLSGNEAFKKLSWFSRGFFKAEERNGALIVSDLRMGMTPDYVFQFAIAERQEDGWAVIAPERILNHRSVEDSDLEWLTARLQGQSAVREIERNTIRLEQAQLPGPAVC